MKHRMLAIVLYASAACAAGDAAAQQRVATHLDRPDTEAQVLGSQYRETVQQALRATARGELAQALDLLKPVLGFCDGLIAGGRRLVSVADAGEYTAYVAAAGNGEPVDWVDMACPEAYHAQAFIAVERNDAQAAFAALGKASGMAPYWVDPLVERGHLLNTTGKPAEALATYRAAQALVDTHPSNRSRQAIVLRGIGYSQTELGDLDAAEQAYRKSLEIEPGNATAENELEYLRQQRDKARPAAKP